MSKSIFSCLYGPVKYFAKYCYFLINANSTAEILNYYCYISDDNNKIRKLVFSEEKMLQWAAPFQDFRDDGDDSRGSRRVRAHNVFVY